MVDPDYKTVNRGIPQIDYSNILKYHGCNYQIKDSFYSVGTGGVGVYTIYLSTRILSAGLLLDRVLPVLCRYKISFDVLRNNQMLSVFNGYARGLESVGKFVTVYCYSYAQAVAILKDLERVVTGINGPEVPGMLRVGHLSYVSEQFFKGVTGDRKSADIPKIAEKEKCPRLLGGYYVPVKLMRRLPKGDTYWGINIRNLCFSPCLIKQGRRHTFDDHYGRDMFDRLDWQYRVLKELAPLKISSQVLDLIYKKECAYLVLSYLEGSSMRMKVAELKGETCWKDLPKSQRLKLLCLFLETLKTVGQLHAAGFLHRDLNVDNILIAPNNKVLLIDLELAYTQRLKQKGPPFGQGIAGYVSPQQRRYEIPDDKDDVYSLAAVLVFIITGRHPIETIVEDGGKTTEILHQVTGSQSLAEIMIQALAPSVAERISLQLLSALVEDEIAHYHTYC
ncbi:protein kinase domain-containing protein [Chitinophaga filiformis]|uniref:Protein kinase domain-containing protein n=1 Tax=Chitinophaga filiformis TaxID=104663 RepID=A0A1G7MK59_CHIFI|nr:protein kinase [Chitinophaga filiformis]SDF61539.1 Protein kinase domain-containing protein [Chitinophaga filiformis]